MSITLIIIIITALVSIASFSNARIQGDLIFYPAAMKSSSQWYRFVTYGFIHADYVHLAFNMISLWSLGSVLEKYIFPSVFAEKGKLLYIALYLLAIIVSVIPDFIRHRTNYGYRALGASGAVSAVIFAAIALEPTLPLGLFFIPVAIPGYLFALLFIILSTYLAKRGRDNIGHGAHITGAIFGLIFAIVAGKVIANYDVVQNFIDAVRR